MLSLKNLNLKYFISKLQQFIQILEHGKDIEQNVSTG